MSGLLTFFVLMLAVFTPGGALLLALFGMGLWMEGIIAMVAIGIHGAATDKRSETTTVKERIVEKIRTVEKKVFIERMSKEDAFAVLNLSGQVSREQVTDAYKAMMKRVHPDTGGSPYLAKKVNEAKQLLLGK
jgi:hypothetical protein